MRRARRRLLLAGVLLLSMPALSACGGVGGGTVVVRVGDRTYSKQAVDRWAAVIARGGAFSGFRGVPRGTNKERALALLITSSWLVDEAARQGVPVTDGIVKGVVANREAEEKDFRSRLAAKGQTLAGAAFEARAELAAEAVREKLAERADAPTRTQALAYYRSNRAMFATPEVRVTDLVENQRSSSQAAAFVRREGTGSRFARAAYHEQVTRTPGVMRTPEKARLVEAIFAARPGVVSSPMPLNGNWTVFVVRKVIPGRPQAFAKVRGEVERRLRIARQKELKASFDREYVALWRARTKCEHGYVGPGCPQYTAPLGAYEDPFSRRAHPLLSEQGAEGG